LVEHLLPKQRVVGSSPISRSRPSKIRVSEASGPPESAQLGSGSPLLSDPPRVAAIADAFLLQKRVGGCSEATLRVYRFWLDRLQAEVADIATLDVVSVTRFFARLRERGVSTSTVHQAYRTLKTFCRWCIATEALAANPLAGLSIRTPKTLPQVPTEDELRAVLACCGDTLEGRRNRALILVLADAGLRAAEVLRLVVEDWNPGQRSLFVRGKGGKDRRSAACGSGES
jgi:integrase/recombinase XerD